jgi:EpsI family protein
VKTLRSSIIAAVLMALAATGGVAARYAIVSDRSAPRYVLQEVIPEKFGDWTVVKEQAQVVNPQSQALLDDLYSQLLVRTYINSRGYRVMLSMAYGNDQRGGLAAHMPEVCYPAQGFRLMLNERVDLNTSFGAIPVTRLSTSMGTRFEPVTYWVTMADTPMTRTFQRRLAELKLALTGKAPDGLLFRISSIDTSTSLAFAEQESFVVDLLKTVPAVDRKRLAGLEPSASH